MRWDHLRQKNWNHTIYISFLRSLFLMLMIPLVMLFAAYIGLNAKLGEQTCERILETLKNGTQKMEMTFDSLDQIGYYLNENSDIIQYYSADEKSIMGHTTDVLRAQKALSSIHISNLDIHVIFLWCNFQYHLFSTSRANVPIGICCFKCSLYMS